MSSSNDPVVEHGWAAVPVDPEAIFKGRPYLHKPSPVLVKDIPFPSDDPIVSKVQKYAKEKLAWQAYNHSMRVFYLCKHMSCHETSNRGLTLRNQPSQS